MTSLKQILKSLYDVFDGICDRTFIEDRPRSVIESLSSYIVIRLVSAVANREISDRGEYNYYVTTVQVEIYVKDLISASNPNQININMMDEKVQEAWSRFPVKDEHIMATKPRVTLTMNDGNGFHCTIIQARLTTLV